MVLVIALRRMASRVLEHRQDGILPMVLLPVPRQTAFYYTRATDFAALEAALAADLQFTFPRNFSKASKIIDFMQSRTAAQVSISLEGESFVLQNFQLRKNGISSASRNDNLVEIVGQGQNQNLPEGLISQALKTSQHLSAHSKKLSSTSKLSQSDLQTLLHPPSQANPPGRPDLQDRIISNFYTLEQLKAEREELQRMADSRFRMYLAGAGLLGFVHVAGFGYMIYGVEWLGWDIVEPLTYSLSQLGVLLAWRFFLKHRQDRSIESIRDVLRRRILGPYWLKLEQINTRITNLERENELLSEYQQALN